MQGTVVLHTLRAPCFAQNGDGHLWQGWELLVGTNAHWPLLILQGLPRTGA
jgi:hypothetical protein